MPTLTQYTQVDFPAVLKWQAIAFMRVEWPYVFQGDGLFASETYPTEASPVHFAVAEGDSLISYAAALRVTVEHQGAIYRVYGFGNMFTFPPYRRQGYGRQVLNLATRHILASDVDLGILFSAPGIEPFYAADGWEQIESPTYVGRPGHERIQDAPKMALWVSEAGRRARSAFVSAPLRVAESW
ncbi:MAG TPA: GNAT family N-acetyltransferase [Roseiflexaceae bacterium]|nr:GNAT family N-acetyltransferase [Roseiflexaceae bacterium]